MRKVVWGVLGVSVLVWLLAMTGVAGERTLWWWRKQLILGTGIVSFSLMSLIMVLAMRPLWLERRLGGLDKLYRIHKWAGIAAIVAALLHYAIKQAKPLLLVFFDAGTKLPKAATFFLEAQGMAKDLGEWTLWFLGAMLILTLWQRFPYHLWRHAHKLLAAVYLVLVFHALVLMPDRWWSAPAGLWVLLCGVVGSLCAVYALLGRIGMHQRVFGEIKQVQALPGEITEVSCEVPASWAHRAGQFAFIRFRPGGEAHPFTISSAPGAPSSTLRFSIKALGDFTRALPQQVAVGQKVEVEGPYGGFTSVPSSENEQVWIGAGIGVTPFLAWLEEMQHTPQSAPKATFYYCVNNEQDAAYVERVRRLCEALPSITLVVHSSDRDGVLSAGRILGSTAAQTPVWFCGPAGFAEAIRCWMKASGRRASLFHCEYFQMR